MGEARIPLTLVVAAGLALAVPSAGLSSLQAVEESDDPLLLQRLGILYIQENQPAEAIRALERSADLYPMNAETHMWLGFAYFLTRQFDRAEESYLRALSVNPRLSEVHNYLGLLWVQRGQPQQAIAEFEAALRDPAYPPASRFRVYLNLGRVQLEEGQLEASLSNLRAAVELAPSREDPAFVLAHLLLGQALHGLGRFQEAVAALGPALEAGPDSADVHLALGLAYRDLGRWEEARRHLEEVLRLAPGSGLSARARVALEQISG